MGRLHVEPHLILENSVHNHSERQRDFLVITAYAGLIQHARECEDYRDVRWFLKGRLKHITFTLSNFILALVCTLHNIPNTELVTNCTDSPRKRS